jgi:hypothetical protein
VAAFIVLIVVPLYGYDDMVDRDGIKLRAFHSILRTTGLWLGQPHQKLVIIGVKIIITLFLLDIMSHELSRVGRAKTNNGRRVRIGAPRRMKLSEAEWQIKGQWRSGSSGPAYVYNYMSVQ